MTPNPANLPMTKRLGALFVTFFKIAAVTIGGGYAMLPVMEQEFVHKRKWVSATDIVDVLAIVQSTPGIIAVNAAVFVGHRVAGFAGAAVASVAVVLPSFLAIVLIAAFLSHVGPNRMVGNAFTGVRAGVCALILLAGVRLGRQILKGRMAWAIAAAAFVAVAVLGINAVWTIAGAGLIGLIWRLTAARGPSRKKGAAK